MNLLELVSDDVYKGFFVDLYVRCTNDLAINMYEGFGYSVYRRVEQYYGSLGLGRAAKDEEDAFGKYMSTLRIFTVFITPRQTCENRYLEIHIDGLSEQTEGTSSSVQERHPSLHNTFASGISCESSSPTHKQLALRR